MLARAHRFHGHASLRFVFSRGKVIRGQHFSLKYVLNPKRKSYRAAVVVSKKVHKSAVVRNRIRRRLYGIIRTSIATNGPPFDFVLTVYAEQVADMPAAELAQAVRGQLKAAGIPLKTTTTHGIVE